MTTDEPKGEPLTEPGITESRGAAAALGAVQEYAWTGTTRGCARCGGQHDDVPLYWRPFHNPVPADDGSAPWTHWAACPITGDPVLSRSVNLQPAESVRQLS